MSDEEFRASPLYQAAKALQEIRERAKALGLFIGDRDLLMCDSCRLMEDVGFHGFLHTYICPDDYYDPEPALDWKAPPDTGLRFLQIAESEFRCPVCGTVIRLEVESKIGLLERERDEILRQQQLERLKFLAS
jgi:hypothetical protein